MGTHVASLDVLKRAINHVKAPPKKEKNDLSSIKNITAEKPPITSRLPGYDAPLPVGMGMTIGGPAIMFTAGMYNEKLSYLGLGLTVVGAYLLTAKYLHFEEVGIGGVVEESDTFKKIRKGAADLGLVGETKDDWIDQHDSTGVLVFGRFVGKTSKQIWNAIFK